MGIKNSTEFIEFLRTINCLNYDEFVDMYGAELGDHICCKRGEKKIGFLFDLDSDVLRTMFQYTAAKIQRRNNEKDA